MTVEAEKLGATVVAVPMEVRGPGRMAIIMDPTRAAFGLWESKGHAGFGDGHARYPRMVRGDHPRRLGGDRDGECERRHRVARAVRHAFRARRRGRRSIERSHLDDPDVSHERIIDDARGRLEPPSGPERRR